MKFKSFEKENGFLELRMYSDAVDPETGGIPVSLLELEYLDFEDVIRQTNNKLVLFMEKQPEKIGDMESIAVNIFRVMFIKALQKIKT